MPDTLKARLAGPSRPLGDPDIPQFYLAMAAPTPKGIFAPRLYGAASVLFSDSRRGMHDTRRVAFLVPIESPVRAIDWDTATPTIVMPADLQSEAPASGGYLPLPAGAMRLTTFTRWAKSFDRWLARTQRFNVTPSTPAESANIEPITIAPKRGGVSVELVAIVWERT